jgi:predicted glycogen debranching enzyme
MKEFQMGERLLSDPGRSLDLEWIDTNGRGGYASTTIVDCHTRKYHGLLVANLLQPPGRFVLLSKVEDSVCCGSKECFLTTHRYPGVFHPEGYRNQTAFRIDGKPCMTFRIGDRMVEKQIMMCRGEERVLIRYSRDGGLEPMTLRIRPFLAFRDVHGLSRENSVLDARIDRIWNGFKIRPYEGLPELCLQVSGKASVVHEPLWYYRFEYPVEADRGFDAHEDLFQPGYFEMPLKAGTDVFFSASLRAFRGRLKAKWDGEERRRKREALEDRTAAGHFKNKDAGEKALRLTKAGRAFLIKDHGKKPAVLAGYPWFYEWGRDSLISLPGLTFCSGRPEEGAAVLKKFAGFEKNGLMPNVLSEDGIALAYNAADSSLWYFWALQQMMKYTGDVKTLKRDHWPVMKRIIGSYMAGTDHRICTNERGLLHAGDSETPLTWMDAKAGGRSVTPRSGFAVDLNALWYNALCFARETAERFDDRTLDVTDCIGRLRSSFGEAFWIEQERYLGDVLSNGILDRAVRPNQILAVSLPHSPLEPPQWKGVVERVKQDLLTPCGLRTLAAGEAGYRGLYGGDVFARDSAYHQGTVWPWLMGHFGEAWLKAAEDRSAAKDYLLRHVIAFLDRHFEEAGIGCVSEVFDGDPPHRPGGCIAQAWSTSELIRLLRLLNDDPDGG